RTERLLSCLTLEKALWWRTWPNATQLAGLPELTSNGGQRICCAAPSESRSRSEYLPVATCGGRDAVEKSPPSGARTVVFLLRRQRQVQSLRAMGNVLLGQQR